MYILQLSDTNTYNCDLKRSALSQPYHRTALELVETFYLNSYVLLRLRNRQTRMKKELLFTSLFVITTIKLSSGSNDAGNGKGCYYNGRYYKSTWEEGCDYICTCINVETGYFRCSRRCPVYKNIPLGCTLELPPEEPCCMDLVCNEQTTAVQDVATNVTDIYTTVSSTTTINTPIPDTAVQNRISNRNDTSELNMAMSNNSNTTSLNMPVVNVTVSSVSSENLTDTISVTNDINYPHNTDINQIHDVTHEIHPADIQATTGHKIGHLMSVEELTPIDVASSNEIFIQIIEGIMPLDSHDNNSVIQHADNGKGNPPSEKASDLFLTEHIPPPVLPNPLKDLVVSDISQDIILTPKDFYDIPSSTSKPAFISLKISEDVLPDNLQKMTIMTKDIAEHTSSLTDPAIDKNVTNGDIASVRTSVNVSDIPNKATNISEEDPIDKRTSTQQNKLDGASKGSNQSNRSVSDSETTSSTPRTDQIPSSTEAAAKSSSGYFDGDTRNTVAEPADQLSKVTIDDIAVKHGHCVFMGMRFDTYQTWFDGCSQFCICLDAKTGLFNCTKRCPVYKSLPKDCVLKISTPRCCPQPDCTKTSELLRNTKLPSAMQRLVTSKMITESAKSVPERMPSRTGSKSTKFSTIHTATGTYRLRGVNGSSGSRVGRLVPASLRNGTASNVTAGKNYSAILQTILGFCLYSGRRYKPGDKWEIGCELVCRCLPGLQGQYACRRRCRKYNVIPFGCSLQPVPADTCCKTIHCPNNTRPTMPRIIVPKVPLSDRGRSNPRIATDNKGTILQQRNGNTHQLAKLLRRNMSSNSSSIRNSSLHSASKEKNSSISNPAIANGAMKRNFTDPWRRTHTGSHSTPSGGKSFSQTGAVLISKQASNQRTGPIQIIATTGCVVGNKVYRRGQSWKIGCRYRCFCNDEIKQTITCTHLCPKWKLPAACKLELPPKGKCCPVPKCANGYRIKYPNGFIQL